jgi:hypothetical protein
MPRLLGSMALLAALGAPCPRPALAGELRGTVHLAGPLPGAAPVEVHKDRESCGTSAPDESLLAEGGRLANAVVQVRGVPGPPPAPVHGALDQVRCRFVPRVQVLPRGSTLDIVSSDPVLHNVHGWIGKATVFNQAMALAGRRVPMRLERLGIIQVRCDVHDWMSAWVVVTEGPAAVTGADGSFAVKDLPAGSYTVVAWHERLGERVAQVTVPADGAASVEIRYGEGR